MRSSWSCVVTAIHPATPRTQHRDAVICSPELGPPKLARLSWRCRRGTRELEWLLRDFLRAGYQDLDAGAQRCFEDLLEYSDPEIMDWLTKRSKPPRPEFQTILRRLRTRSKAKVTVFPPNE